jgi:hypothetical protein
MRQDFQSRRFLAFLAISSGRSFAPFASFAVKGVAFQFSLFGNFGDFGNLVLGVPQPALSDPELAKGESNGWPLW